MIMETGLMNKFNAEIAELKDENANIRLMSDVFCVGRNLHFTVNAN
jgi:hypothetical protein